DPTYANTSIQFIPNMDGFPNGRRLEDDVTRIELQAVGGIVLAALGLWYDDYTVGDANPVTQDLQDVLGYTTGVEKNDTTFRGSFPYVQLPWAGTSKCGGAPVDGSSTGLAIGNLGLSTPVAIMAPAFVQNNTEENNTKANGYPNPFISGTTIQYHVAQPGNIKVTVYDMSGNLVRTLEDTHKEAGRYDIDWDANNSAPGTYNVVLTVDRKVIQTLRVVKAE
nr:DUF4331 family protein [Bacteroidota bacterium]